MAALWLIPAAMLVLALLQLPYGYYTLLRLVVCLTAAIIAFQSWPKHQAWAIAFGFVALLFNPLIIVALDRGTWAPIDVAVAAMYLLHWWVVGRHKTISD
jgi:hypothetical protein